LHGLGLALVHQQEYDEACQWLRRFIDNAQAEHDHLLQQVQQILEKYSELIYPMNLIAIVYQTHEIILTICGGLQPVLPLEMLCVDGIHLMEHHLPAAADGACHDNIDKEFH
jgi:lysine/ornithine N-monooxygenase